MAVAIEMPRRAPRRPRVTRVQQRAVEQELARTSEEVVRLAQPALDALRPVLAQAERETAHALRAWLETVPDGEQRFTAQQRRNVLLHLRKALDTIARLQPTLAGALESAGHAAGVLSANHLVREVARYSRLFEGSERRVALNVTKILAVGDRYLVPRFQTSARRYASAVADDIRRELAVGVVRGESVSGLTDRLARLSGFRQAIGSPSPENIAAGLTQRHRYWAERLVRTETQSAYNHQLDEGLRQAKQQIPDLMRRWDASLDLRVCRVCAGLHGEITEIGKPFEGGYDGAPAHPNCRCRVGAWREEWSGTAEPRYELELRSPDQVDAIVPRNLSPSEEADAVQAVGEAVTLAGMDDWLRANRLTEVVLEQRIGSPPYPADAVGAHGMYDRQTRTLMLEVDRASSSWGSSEQGVTLPSVSNRATTARAALQRTAVHELTHHIIQQCDARSANAEIQQMEDALVMAIATDVIPSQVACPNWKEYLCELHVRFVFEHDALRAEDPEGYHWIQWLRQRAGISP